MIFISYKKNMLTDLSLITFFSYSKNQKLITHTVLEHFLFNCTAISDKLIAKCVNRQVFCSIMYYNEIIVT